MLDDEGGRLSSRARSRARGGGRSIRPIHVLVRNHRSKIPGSAAKRARLLGHPAARHEVPLIVDPPASNGCSSHSERVPVDLDPALLPASKVARFSFRGVQSSSIPDRFLHPKREPDALWPRRCHHDDDVLHLERRRGRHELARASAVLGSGCRGGAHAEVYAALVMFL